jgi:hypothetical protein
MMGTGRQVKNLTTRKYTSHGKTLTKVMNRFPADVRKNMAATGAAATCVPVKLDGEDWEAAVFMHLTGPESKEDRRLLRKAKGSVPLGIETDLIENAHAAVVVLRVEVYTVEEDPLVGEILFTPGEVVGHFETLRLLSRQHRLCWFFGSRDYEILHSQQHPLEDEQHAGFDDLIRDAVRHDSLIRCSGKYDAHAALAEVVSNYELRAGVWRAGKLDAGRMATDKPAN